MEVISAGIPAKENKSVTKESPFNSAASLGKPKSILPIISSTSKGFSFNGDCLALLLSPGFFTWRNHLFGYFSSCLFFTIHTALVLNKQRTIALQIKVLRWEKERGAEEEESRRGSFFPADLLVCLPAALGGGDAATGPKKEIGGGGALNGEGGGWERGQKYEAF